MAVGCGEQGTSESGVLAPPSCGVADATPRRSSLRLPLSLAPRSPRFATHLGSASWCLSVTAPRWRHYFFLRCVARKAVSRFHEAAAAAAWYELRSLQKKPWSAPG